MDEGPSAYNGDPSGEHPEDALDEPLVAFEHDEAPFVVGQSGPELCGDLAGEGLDSLPLAFLFGRMGLKLLGHLPKGEGQAWRTGGSCGVCHGFYGP